MSACVLDASVTIAWFIPGESDDATDRVLSEIGAIGADVPSYWRLEVANVLLIAERRKRIDRLDRERALTRLRDLPLVVDPHTADLAWSDISALAVEHRLTLYDAAYLELAMRLRLPLASRDIELRRAAQTCGVRVVGM